MEKAEAMLVVVAVTMVTTDHLHQEALVVADLVMMEKAVEIVVTAGKASASYLQRRLKIGYNRAARLVEGMEAQGIVGPPNGSKPREILYVPDLRIRG